MIAIILSAGAGSRLLPLTATMPKCLVEVGGRSILSAQLDALAEAGVSRAVVVGGYRHRQIEEHLALHSPAISTELVFNPFWPIASSISSVWTARDHLSSDFCLMNGDTVFEPAVLAGAIAVAPVGVSLLVEPIADAAVDDMLVTVAGERVMAVGKDLALAEATHRSLGVILSRGDGAGYRAALTATIDAPGGTEAYHHDIVDRLARTGEVAAIVAAPGAWQEIDRPEDIAGWTVHHPGG